MSHELYGKDDSGWVSIGSTYFHLMSRELYDKDESV